MSTTVTLTKSRRLEFAPLKLKKLRKKSELSLSALGDKIGVSKQSIDQYERGANVPSLENFLTMCSELGCTPNDLLKFRR